MCKSMIEFEWDELKLALNVEKHGVDFSEAVLSFFDPFGLLLEDEKHTTDGETRFYWVGFAKGRVLTTYFTWRASKIRIIGCAEWRKFRRLYERAKTQELKNQSRVNAKNTKKP